MLVWLVYSDRAVSKMNWKLEEVVDEDMVDGMMGDCTGGERKGKDNRA